MKEFDEKVACEVVTQAEALMMSAMPYIPPSLEFAAIQDAYDGVREALEKLQSAIVETAAKQVA